MRFRQLLLVLILLAACGGPELEELPRPILDGFAEPAREQIEAQQAQVEALTADGTKIDRQAAWGLLGRLYHTYGLWQPALTAYRNAEKLAPAEPRWVFLIAHTHRQAGDTEAAVAGFERALELGVTPALPAHVWAARGLLEQGRGDDAQAHLEAALDLDSECAVCLFLQGELAAGRGDHQTAIERFQKVLTVQPAADRVWVALAQSLRASGDLDAAATALTRRGENQVALDDPLLADVQDLAISAPALITQGADEFEDGNVDIAARLFAEAATLDPDHAPAFLNLGAAEKARGNYAAAERALRRALEIEPDTIGHFNLGVVLAAQGDDDGAREQYRAALTLDPSHTGAMLNLANGQVREGRCRDAVDHYTRIVALAPQMPGGHRGLAYCAFQAGAWRKAATALETGLAALPEDPALRNLHARILAAAPVAELRDPDAAVATAQLLVRDAPDIDHVLTLAMALAAAGRFDEAIAWQGRALTAVEQAGRSDLVADVRAALDRYRAGRSPVLEPGV